MPNNRSTGKYINNGKINKRVLDSEIESYINKGWELGMKPRSQEQIDISNKKRESTCLNKYGVTNVGKSPLIKSKISTSIYNKYGVYNAFQSEEIKNQIKNKNKEKYGVEFTTQIESTKEKIKSTKLSRYRDENYTNSNKAKATLISKYGSLTEFYKNRTLKTKETFINTYGSIEEAYNVRNSHTNYDESVKKQIQTKYKNKSFNTSKAEEKIYLNLVESYGSENVIRQYAEKRYPYNCDFYIPSEDMFIEVNKHWTHGGRSFDCNNEDCIKQLNIWKEKAKTSKFYSLAIQTWTIRDVEKLKCAQDNNLNYQIIW